MSAAIVVDRITTAIGGGPIGGARRRRLPMLRCEKCRAALISDIVAPNARLVSCEGCGRGIDRRTRRCSECRAKAAAAVEAAARIAAMPRRHELARFGSAELATWCRDRDAIARAFAFAERPPPACRVLLFTGPTDAGKSSLVSAVVQHLEARGRCRRGRVAWATASQIATCRREHPLGAGKPPLLVRALGADVNVVDDLGKELVFPGPEAAEVVTLLENRHAGERGVVPEGALDIVTTELPVVLADEEVAALEQRGQPARSLARCYDLSFVRRIAGALIDAEVVRGSAVVIHVRAQ